MSDVKKRHHGSRCFRNNYDNPAHGFAEFFQWRWDLLRKRLHQGRIPCEDFPLAANDPAFLRQNRTQPTLTWVGQSTFLLQIEGMNLLTDPHFTERASPLSWIGPKRWGKPGLSIEQLPEIDFVLISHNHYDHLDLSSVRQLVERAVGKHPPRFFVPLGLKAWFEEIGIAQVTELDWWEMATDRGWTFHAVPAQHFSGRSLSDRNQTLWAGWVAQRGNFKFFFAGDTGYSPDFLEIGQRLGPFDLSALPIGAYDPRWFMQPVHVNPEEAAQIHKDIRSRRSVAMHWGTFKLTDEPMREPPRRLAEACARLEIPANEFLVLQHGETLLWE